MEIDAETKIFLKNRFDHQTTLHHTLKPIQLRKERLEQLKKDNLSPPKVLEIVP